jgi:DNA-binding transcriptional ArsR family regulator
MQAQLKALADPTRQQIFELAAEHELSAGQIAEHFAMSRPAVSQHIGILRDAGLLGERRDGVRRLYAADASGLAGIREFVDRFWETRLDALKTAAESAHEQEEGERDARAR